MKKYVFNPPPKVGDVKHGYAIGYTNYNLYTYIACPICKDTRWVQVIGSRPVSEYCQQCSQKNRSRKNRPFRANSFMDGNGYIRIKLRTTDPYWKMANSKSGYVMEHRLVMAKSLGRCLEDWEIVHHLNGMNGDNRIDNLVIVGYSKKQKTYLEHRLEDAEKLNEAKDNRIKSLEEKLSLLENPQKPLDS